MQNVTFDPQVGRIIHFKNDALFSKIYGQALRAAQQGDNTLRRMRQFNVASFLATTKGLPGSTAEAGTFRGLSSYVVCAYQKHDNPTFDGSTHHIFDSFRGLSPARPEDQPPKGIKSNAQTGRHAAGMDIVRQTLSDFPEVKMFKGWIPDVMKEAPAGATYRFAHIDVDLYEPTLGAAEYFLPRMVPGGIVICDDYGFLSWPGATQAIDESAKKHGFRVACLSAGNAVLMKQP